MQSSNRLSKNRFLKKLNKILSKQPQNNPNKILSKDPPKNLSMILSNSTWRKSWKLLKEFFNLINPTSWTSTRCTSAKKSGSLWTTWTASRSHSAKKFSKRWRVTLPTDSECWDSGPPTSWNTNWSWPKTWRTQRCSASSSGATTLKSEDVLAARGPGCQSSSRETLVSMEWILERYGLKILWKRHIVS